MDKDEIEKCYKNAGLVTEYVRDDPGKVYRSHRHEKTYLSTISGSASIKTELPDSREVLRPGEDFIVGTIEYHKAVVGGNGWEYVAAWGPEEAKDFKH